MSMSRMEQECASWLPFRVRLGAVSKGKCELTFPFAFADALPVGRSSGS